VLGLAPYRNHYSWVMLGAGPKIALGHNICLPIGCWVLLGVGPKVVITVRIKITIIIFNFNIFQYWTMGPNTSGLPPSKTRHYGHRHIAQTDLKHFQKVPKALGPASKQDPTLSARPKTLPKVSISLALASKQDPTLSVRPKTLPKSINTVGSCLQARPNTVDTDTLQCGRHCSHSVFTLWTTL
jgi:hypothetical protein